ncbi:MAG: hypothetical protein ABIT83_20215 [Massilia sp.]
MRSFEFNGARIVENPMLGPTPRIQATQAFEAIQSPELVASTNAWMKDFFGMHDPIYFLENKVVVMSPGNLQKLRAEMLRPTAAGAGGPG